MSLDRLLAICLIVFALHPSAFAQSKPPAEDIRAELDELKKGQEAIQKELEQIRRLLTARQQAPAAAPRQGQDSLPSTIDIAQEPGRGDGKAQIAIIEYSDYECPFCARYVQNTYPQVDREYVQTGKVRYIFRDLPLNFHKNAQKAAEASHCAGEQGRFWEMHDRLFANNKALAGPELTKHAEAIALDGEKFRQCLESGRFAEEVRKDARQANALGITGTPTFVIGLIEPDSSLVRVKKKLVGARPYTDFKTAIDELLEADD